MAAKTFYEILDVSREADAKTVKKAFKKMALRYHPDVNKEVRWYAIGFSGLKSEDSGILAEYAWIKKTCIATCSQMLRIDSWNVRQPTRH